MDLKLTEEERDLLTETLVVLGASGANNMNWIALWWSLSLTGASAALGAAWYFYRWMVSREEPAPKALGLF